MNPNNMKHRRVMLFDLSVSGHHINYASYLIRYLCGNGYEVTLFTLKEDPRLELLADELKFTVKYAYDNAEAQIGNNVMTRYAQMFRSLRRCFQFADESDADVVHILCVDYDVLPLYFKNLRYQKHTWHLFATLFSPYFIHDRNEKVNCLRRLKHISDAFTLKRMLEKRLLSALFVHTNAIKELLTRRFGWQEHYSQRIVVIPDPLEISYRRYSKEEARERLQLPKDIPILLFFGGLRRSKGPDILLDAIKSLDQDFRLVIAGPPDYTAQSDIESCKEQLDNPVKIIDRLKYIPEGEVDCYFLSTDVVVLPYRKDFKGTSGILQHACAAGKPVVATNVGEIGRIVKEHSLGIVVEPGSPHALRNGIQCFLTDREAITAVTAPKCLQYASENTWNKMASLVESTYQSHSKDVAFCGNS